MRVSIVVPVYNGAKFIARCLESLLSQDYPDHEVIVVDDGSTDETAQIVEKYPVRLIRGPHRGISAARNQGIKASNGGIILVVDSDLTVPRDLARRLIAPLRDKNVGVTMAWWDIQNPDNLIACLIFRVYEYFVRNLYKPNFFWGYCFALRKELFYKLGYFDESLALVEDVDFAYRITAAGYHIRILKDVRVWHYFRDSLKAHLIRHFKTARHKFLYVLSRRRFSDERGSPSEYYKLGVHFLTLISFFLLPWLRIPFFIFLSLSLLSHLPLTFWGMKKGFKYILLLPFEFLTKMAWVLGVIQGAWWGIRGYYPQPSQL